MRKKTSVFLLALLGAAASLLAERGARACGGCFHPPTETDSVITDHRMAFTITPQQTTLWDQIHYTGNPADFAWVLPISGTATLGISADSLFGALDVMTQTTVQAPDPKCPAAPTDCKSLAVPGAASGSSSGGGGGGVVVTKQETVGPYATVQLHSTDPNALTAWLQQNGYAIPDPVAPVIAAYVNEHYDFLALKLKPGANVTSMRPIRVSTPGASPVLPLRMVAAGTGATVGVTLWVVAEGRYATQNFPSFTITSQDLVWDWPTSTSNYKTLRAKLSDGRAWENESSLSFPGTTIQNAVKYGYYYGPGSGFGGSGGAPASANDYAPETDQSGAVTKTADQVRDEDLATLLGGLANVRVTRLRADLAHASLAADLDLQASADQSVLDSLRIPTGESGQPQCPVYQGCNVVGSAPRDQVIGSSGGSSASGGCSTAPGARFGAPLALLGLAALGGAGIARSRKRRG